MVKEVNYLISEGKDKGAYTRVDAATRLVSPKKIKELEMEDTRISWDELTCAGYRVTENAIKKLCRDMNKRRREMQQYKSYAGKLPTVTRANLEDWKLLKKTHDGYLASNAFVLLTSDYFPFSKTQCAVFKGTGRSVFVDKREYTGPIYTQIEEAVNFVLRNIRLGAKIKVLVRQEFYELPVDAIEEMIINAHCHRSLKDESCVQVAIYDDRLEVSSPGGLYNGLTLEEALQGHSRLRNRAIANVFSQIGLIKARGTGLRRIQKAAREYDLPEPAFIEMPESFRVNLFRTAFLMQGVGSISLNFGYNVGDITADVGDNVGDATANVGDNVGDATANVGDNVGDATVDAGDDIGDITTDVGGNVGDIMEDVGDNVGYSSAYVGGNVGKKSVKSGDTKEKVLRIISNDNRASASKIAKNMSVTQRTVERYIQELREEGRLVRHGSAYGGHWEVIKKEIGI